MGNKRNENRHHHKSREQGFRKRKENVEDRHNPNTHKRGTEIRKTRYLQAPGKKLALPVRLQVSHEDLLAAFLPLQTRSLPRSEMKKAVVVSPYRLTHLAAARIPNDS